jgi:soluble lytic murein transglycosylase-like protein
MPDTVQDLIRQAATKHGVPAELALAVAEQESGFNPTLINPKKVKTPAGEEQAIGTFQFLPSTAKGIGIDPYDPRQNIDGGARYLRELMDRHEGNLDLVLREYGGVKTNTTYVPSVLARLKKFKGTATAPVTQGTSLPVAATAGMMASSTPTGDPVRGRTGSLIAGAGPPVSSPVPRFIKAVGNSAIGEPIEGVIALARGMWDDPLGTMKALGTGITEPIVTNLKAATAAREAGDAKAWTQSMLKAVPLLGPVWEQIAAQQASGDTAGAMGRAFGTAATFALPATMRGIREVKPTGAVPLLRSERTGSGVSQFIEQTVERTVAGRSVFRAFRERQQRALQSEGERLAQSFAHLPLGDTDTALIVRRGIEQSLQDRKLATGQLYDMIDDMTASRTRRVAHVEQVPSRIVGPSGESLTVPQRTLRKVEVGGVQPETRILKTVALPMLRRIRQEGKLIPPQELARTVDILTQIIKSPKTMTFSAFQDARSSLLAIVRSHGDPIPGKAGGAAKLLAGAADDAMMTAARKSGIPNLEDFVREANALWHEAKTVYNAPFIEKILKESPETIPALIRAADIDELTLLRSAVQPATFKAAQARIMRDMFELATDAPVPSGTGAAAQIAISPTAAVQNYPRLSGQKIMSELRRMGPEKAETLFGRDGVKGLQEIAHLAEIVKPQDVNRVAGGLVSAGINASILGGLLYGTFTRGAAAPASAAAMYASINSLSRVLTRPEGITSVRRFLHSLSVGNRPLAIAAGMRLSVLIGQENDLLTARASGQPTTTTAQTLQQATAPPGTPSRELTGPAGPR